MFIFCFQLISNFLTKKTCFAKHSPTFSFWKAGLLFISSLKWKIYHWYPLRVYKGLRTLQAASLPFWVIGAGTLSGGFVALSKRVTAVHNLKHIQVQHFTFVLGLSRQKNTYKRRTVWVYWPPPPSSLWTSARVHTTWEQRFGGKGRRGSVHKGTSRSLISL